MQASQSKTPFSTNYVFFVVVVCLFVCLFFKASGQYNRFILFELKIYFSLSSFSILL